ncbi:hypothetical protein G6011_02777 [Alternaria panax]|uniref:Uncharacterized protein n=1 Tax=Alternaria panax TaxID=48097 RepID=A0AAD4I759_9PLEO|nr:hypothetical protein G6011_02777 [Alternaria panax]
MRIEDNRTCAHPLGLTSAPKSPFTSFVQTDCAPHTELDHIRSEKETIYKELHTANNGLGDKFQDNANLSTKLRDAEHAVIDYQNRVQSLEDSLRTDSVAKSELDALYLKWTPLYLFMRYQDYTMERLSGENSRLRIDLAATRKSFESSEVLANKYTAPRVSMAPDSAADGDEFQSTV